jgi:hypothetical protein
MLTLRAKLRNRKKRSRLRKSETSQDVSGMSGTGNRLSFHLRGNDTAFEAMTLPGGESMIVNQTCAC